MAEDDDDDWDWDEIRDVDKQRLTVQQQSAIAEAAAIISGVLGEQPTGDDGPYYWGPSGCGGKAEIRISPDRTRLQISVVTNWVDANDVQAILGWGAAHGFATRAEEH